MDVSSLKKITPLAEAYELDPNCSYLVCVPSDAPKDFARQLAMHLQEMGIEKFSVIYGDTRFYEVEQ